MSSIELNSVTMQYPDGTVAFEQLTLGVDEGETLVLIGPSGCGKTTTLRVIAGLEMPTSGQVRIGRKDVSQVAPRDRNVAMMFQSDALYPHMSVRGNLSFGLKLQSHDGRWLRGLVERVIGGLLRSSAVLDEQRGIEAKVRQAAEQLGIERLLDRKPHQLSGGERQRVALGRAMVRDPAAFLLDEPFSRLDAPLARELRGELKRLFRELGKPVVFVTHDQREAMTLADRIAVMDNGKLIQVGKPLDVYQRPANLFVASFVGDVPINVLPRAVVRDDNSSVPEKADRVGFRSEHVDLSGESMTSVHCAVKCEARVCDVERMGDHARVYLKPSFADSKGREECGLADLVVARCSSETNYQRGDRISMSVSRCHLLWFDDSGSRLTS